METGTAGRHLSHGICEQCDHPRRGLSLAVVASVIALLNLASIPSRAQRNETEHAVRVEIPFKLYNRDLVVVKGNIGALENQNILLDTGTSPSIISRNTAQLLDLHGTPELVSTLNEAIQTERITLPPIEIGSMSFQSGKAVIIDLDFLKHLGMSVSAVMGIDLLKAKNFTIDYVRKKIIFGAAESQHLARFQIQTPFCLVQAKIHNQDFRLILDSAAPGILLYGNRIKTLHQLRTDGNSLIVTASGTTQSQWFPSRVSVGSSDLGLHPIVISNTIDAASDFDGLLGFTQMGFRRVSFDFAHGVFGWD